MSPDQDLAERVIDVRGIAPSYRHPIILRLFDNLDVGRSFQLLADHDPRPLRYQFEARYGGGCKWTYLERGPDVWRIHLIRAADQSEPV